MKKYLSILAVAAMVASASAQGLVSFVNSGTTLIKDGAIPNDPAAAALGANAGFVQLYWAPTGSPYTGWNGENPTAWAAANPAWAGVASSIKALGPVAGRFNAGGITVPTAAAGATIDAVVVAWAGNYASFQLAYDAGAHVGVSSKFTVVTGNPNTTPPGTAASITTAGFTGLQVAP